MGLPSYYKYIIKKYPEIIEKKLTNIDNLFLDFNGSIYNAYHKVGTNEKLIIKQCLEDLDELIELTNPNILFIAIDGVAPRAKMRQQRLRRFKSVYDKNMQDEIKKSLNMKIDTFDKNAFTPGTVFMNKLNIALKEHVKTYKFKTILSDSNIPSEGEHKILEFLRENKVDGNTVLYGLDADLIMLLLTLNISNTYIMRFQDQLYKFINMDTFKNKFDTVLKEKLIVPYELNKIITDYVFICFLMGNDFLPHIPGLDIYNNGIDKLLSIYFYNFNKYKTYIVDGTTINKLAFLSLLGKISRDEDILLKNIERFKKKTSLPEFENEYQKRLYFAEQKVLEHEDLVRFSEKGWKHRYYKHNFYLDYKNKKYIQDICQSFFTGMQWTLKYYFKGCPSWNWCYEYLHGPCLSDLYYYLKYNWKVVEFKLGYPYKPVQQLLTVLPPQSSHLLPEKYQNLMINSLSPLIKYYPIKIKLNVLNQHIYWKCFPKVPMMNEELLFKHS